MFKKVLLLLIVLAMPVFLFAQSSGKVVGIVKDKETGEPLPGVNVVLQNTYLGATTDVDGYYVILNVPVGKYNIEASYVGYTKAVFQGIRVSAGITTEQNFALQPTTLELGEAVVVVATRPLVEKHVTQSIARVTAQDLEAIPVRGTNAILALQPSVVVQDGNVYIRGGRAEEVGYYLDGASTVNPLNRRNNVHVIQEAVEEVQVLTGGYTAEFGNANAGIVRSELRTGGSDYHFSVDAQTDKFAAEGEKFLGTYSYREHIITATASGPLLLDNLRFFIAYENQDIGDTQKRFSSGFDFNADNMNAPLVDANPLNPRNDPTNPDFHPDTLTALRYPDGFTPDNWYKRHSINSTLLYDMDQFKLRFSGVYTYSKNFGISSPMLNVLNTRQQPYVDNTLLLSTKMTYVLSPSTFLDAKISYFMDSGHREDDWYGTDWRSWSDSAKIQADHGITYRTAYDPDYNYFINGFSFRRDGTLIANYSENKQNYIGGALNFVSQFNKNHELKFGLDARMYSIRQYSVSPSRFMKDAVKYGGEENIPAGILAEDIGNVYGYDPYGNELDEGFDGVKKPLFFSSYFQDKIEYQDLIINAGLRLDYFDTKDHVLLHPDNPVIDKEEGIVDPAEWKEKDPMIYVSPRLGISFPVSDKTVFYAQYGKFVQMPSFNDFYYSSYAYGRQVGGGYFFTSPVGFDIDPMRTTSYEVGFRQQVGDFAAFDITGFYKNIKGQIQADRITPAPGASIQSYNVITNGDFATTKGLEFKLVLRRVHHLQAQINYTLTNAEGTGSGNTSFISAVDRLSARPTMLNPLDFNQTHRGTVNLDYRFGKGEGGPALERMGFNILYTFNSGHPYTLVSTSGGQAGPYSIGVDYMQDTRSRVALEPINSSSTPWVHRVDFRIDKSFGLGDNLTATVYMRINNLFNIKNVLNVYELTGSPEDDGFLSNILNPDKTESFINSYGGEDYVKMYRAINLTNGQAYWNYLGKQLYDHPRQIFIGVKFAY